MRELGYRIELGAPDMHVRIERLYEFLMAKINLTEGEQSHLARCEVLRRMVSCLRSRKDFCRNHEAYKRQTLLGTSLSKNGTNRP